MDPLNLFGVSEVSQNNFPPPSSRHVLEACEKQDWAALRELVPLPNTIEEPQLSAAELSRMKALRHKQARDTAAESSVDLFGAAVSAAGNAASAASEAGNAASTAASAAAGSLIDTSGRTGTVGKDDVDDQHADVDTGMTALHWIARHGRVGEADYIAPIVELRVEFLALKAAGRAEAGQETEGGAPDAFAFMAAAATSESATSESGAGQEEGAVATLSSTRQRLRRDLSSDELGVWRDLTGATPLHHLAYNPTAQRDASTAQELVAEFCRVTGADVDGVDELGSTAMHTAATTNNSKVVTSLLWIGADPYKVDAYGNTPQLTADLYGHAAISVGLKAVLKRERQLSQSLSVFDEEERGVERSEAFQVAVAHSLETLEEEDEDRSASSSMDTTPPRPSGFSSSPTPAISANSSNSAQGVATAIAPEVAGAAAAAGGQASLADASEQFWDGMSAKLGGDGNGLEGGADPNAASSSSSSSSSWSSRHAESVVEDMQTLAQSLAVLEAKVEYSSAKRLDAAQRLGVLSGNLRRKSAAFSESQEKWAAEEKAFQVEDERRRFERRQGPTTAPVLSFTALNFGLFKDEAEEEAVDKATNDNDDPLSVWQEVARRVSASSELGASFVLSALAEGSAAVGGDNGNDNNKHNFTGGGDSGFSWDGTLKKAHEDGGQQEKEDGDGGNDEETALGRDFLTDSEFKLASELEAQSSALASSISRRDEAAGMAIADYEAQGLREEFNAATFHPSATFRPQGAWAALATLDNTATAGGTRGEGGGGKNGSNELAADATARVFAAEQAHEQAVEKAMETSLMRRLKARTRVGSGAGVEPTSTAFLHAPQATYQARNTATNAASTGGLPRRRQSGARGGYGGDGNGNGDGEVDEDDEEERHARRLLVAAALEAEYVAEKRALRSSVVGGFDYSRLPGGARSGGAAKGSGTSSSPSKGVASTTQGKGGASSSSLGKMFGGAGDGVNESGAGSSGPVPGSPLPRGVVQWGEGLESSRAPTDSARLHFLKPPKKQNQRGATSAISGLSIDALAASLTASADVTKRHPGLMKKANQQAALDEKNKAAKPSQNKVDSAAAVAAANAASGSGGLGQERKLTKREALVLEALERSRAGKAGTKQGKLSAEAAAEAAEATWRKSANSSASASGASASALAVAELHALDPVRKLSKAARRELREHFDLFVVGQSNGDKSDLADPYSLDFMTKKKRQAKEAASISEKDLRILVRSLGWHSLTDSEVGQFCTATTTAAAAAVSRSTHEEGRVLDELIKQNNAAPCTEDEQNSGAGEDVDQKKKNAGKDSSSANGKQTPTKKQLKKGKSDVGDAADAPGAAAASAAAPTPTTTSTPRTTTTTRKINFQNFLSLLATKTINEAKLSQALRDEFREAFELFVEIDDDGLGDGLGLSPSATHTSVQQTVSVKAVETVMASLDLKLKANEVAALAANARANAAYRKTKNRAAGGAGGRRGSFVARNGGAAAYLNTAAASAVSAAAADGELEASSASLLVDLPTGFRTLALKLQALADEAEAEEIAGYELAAEDAILEVGEAKGKAKAVDAEAAGGAFSYESFMQASQAAALELEKATRKASAAAASASGARQRAFGADDGEQQLEAGGSGAPSAAASALKQAKEEAKSKKNKKKGDKDGEDDEEDDFSDLVFPNEAKQEALRSEQRLEGFIDAFHAGSEASFEVATARLKALEQQRLQHAVRALKPLLLELERAEGDDEQKRGNEKEKGGNATSAANTESSGGGSSGASATSSAPEGSLYERELAERRQQVEKAASEGFYQLSAMFSGAMGSSGGDSGSQAAAVDQQTVSAPPPQNEASRDVQGDAQTDAQADGGGGGRGEEEGAPALSASLSEEEEHVANGDVWDEVELAWLGSEEAARREVARAQAWAEDVTRDHLVWYTAEFPNSTYEEWVAAFAPENAREYLAGKQTSVDHRFYFPNAVHLKLWNGAIEASGDAARWHRRVEPRLY